MELFKSRTRVAYTNAVGDKVYPVVVDIKKGIKSTEDIQFVSSDVNTGILSVAFISGNENFNVSGADVVCSVMRPDASTLELPCEVVRENIVEVPLGINGTSQDGVYSFDFKVLKGGNKVIGTPIMNYSVSLSIGNDMVVEEDDRLPVLTMLMTQLTELKGEARESINQANVATEASREATANAIEATNKANETVNKVTQDTANAIANVNATSDTMVENVNNAISSMDTTVNSKISEMTDVVNNKISEVDIAKNEITTTVSNKLNDVENRFNALTSSQQQDAEVIDARVDFKGVAFNSLKERIDYTDKLLRDSTISTVTTESDFTTVEATSNGYFEDVKLEGKTLVNLGSNTNLWGVKSSGKSGVDYNIISTNDRNICMNKLTDSVDYIYFCKNIDANLFKANTEYTIVCNVNNVTNFGIMSGNTKEKIIDYVAISNGYNCFKAISTDLSTVTGVQNILIYGLVERNLIADNCSISDVIILEGDHTQNPPSFFEGLKSVGENTDEIVVSSVNENLFDEDNVIFTTIGNNYGVVEKVGVGRYRYIGSSDASKNWGIVFKQVKLPPNSNFSISFKKDIKKSNYERLYIKSSSGSVILDKFVDSREFNFTTGVDDTYIFNFYCGNGTVANIEFELYDVCIKNKHSNFEYTPHQSDKKRLLYYNEETQAWEKPILREWDSIEKHADGKYYYHKRSDEVKLTGNEPPTKWGQTECFMFRTWQGIFKDDVCVCDKLPFINVSTMYGQGIIGVACNSNGVILNVGKSTVEEMKEWLQTNPVTVVCQLAQEKVYECTNIDLITYANETNYLVESGVLSPKTTLKVHNNISNVVSLLQKKVSLLESNVKASQEVQDMMILETDMRMLDIELALMEFAPMKLNLGGSNMLRSATYFNFLKNHIVNETYEKEYLENVMNKYLATGRINQDEYDELYKMLYPPVYDIELPIER